MDQATAVNPAELTTPQLSFQELASQHSLLESQLRQLSQKRFLSPQEELECQRLKKLKLHLKDEMQLLRRTGS